MIINMAELTLKKKKLNFSIDVPLDWIKALEQDWTKKIRH